jgi:hypothetical protein
MEREWFIRISGEVGNYYHCFAGVAGLELLQGMMKDYSYVDESRFLAGEEFRTGPC